MPWLLPKGNAITKGINADWMIYERYQLLVRIFEGIENENH
jgi:hypothetical protein